VTDLVPEPVTELDALTDDTSPSTARSSGPEMLHAIDEQLLDRLVGQARDGGLQLTGEGGLLAQLTKRLVESALEGELTDHLGYGKHDAAGRDGGNSRNGHRSKTVHSELGVVGAQPALEQLPGLPVQPASHDLRFPRFSGVFEDWFDLANQGGRLCCQHHGSTPTSCGNERFGCTGSRSRARRFAGSDSS